VTETLAVGSKAPDFTLPDQNGKPFHLADQLGKVIVLFFYPKDNSAGCTMEACSFRDSYQDFQDVGADVIGISTGTLEDKQTFIQKNSLPYTLLNDADGTVEQAYGIGKTMFGLFKQRVTFVIDANGRIAHRFESTTNMGKHAQDALDTVKRLVSAAV